MPKDMTPRPKPTSPVAQPKRTATKEVPMVSSMIQPPSPITMEVDHYINGVFATFRENFSNYIALTQHERTIQARLELAEKTLCLTREHLLDTLKQAGNTATPKDWEPLLSNVRFVGVRLIDACYTVLSEKKKMTSDELLTAMNGGGYRFRTTSPLREIHAAMLKSKRYVRKVGNEYVWIGGGETIEMRPKVVTPVTADTTAMGPTGTERK